MRAKNRIADEIRKGLRLPELLSPAGSYKALEAAIEGGADAVYLGGTEFNARINAKNFTDEELKRGIALAHSFGKKVYIAANTLIFDRELDGFLRSAENAYKYGADALIIADMGAAAEVARRIPIELHASTQCACHSLEFSNTLENAGFSRMVCAREMSEENIRLFIDSSPLEVEVFVHGALCVCHSGQCLFSSMVGGRSGNRGECAQPCRLPYRARTKKDSYPLSLKDLTLCEHVKALCSLGVASLKIEGRMKSPEYVGAVTAVWRRLLDEHRNATREEYRELEGIFSRDGFTDAYFTDGDKRAMTGIRTEAQKRETRTLKAFEGISRKIKVDASVKIRSQEPIMLTLVRESDKKSVTVTGDLPMSALTAPINEETLRRQISKLGDTPYVLGDLRAELDGGLIVPVSALNALRRRAVEELDAIERQQIKKAEYLYPTGKKREMRTAVFYNPERIPSDAYSYFDIIYTPLEKYTGRGRGILLPPVIFDSEAEQIKQMLIRAGEQGATDALVSSFGQTELARKAGFAVHGNLSINATNSSTVALYEKAGASDMLLSPELTLAQLRDIGGVTGAVVYGRIPLMVTEKCVGREIGDCKTCEAGRAVLTDRRGMEFPVLRTTGHRSLIFNSVPVYMADKQRELDRMGIIMRHFIFTTETRAEAQSVIDAYKKELPPKDAGKIKRIK